MKDFLGQELAIADVVIAADGHELACYRIEYFSPKMVRVKRISNNMNPRNKGKLRYARELYKVPPEMATFYLLSLK